MALKAACPGVSKNVTDPDLIVTLTIEMKLISDSTSRSKMKDQLPEKAPICCVIPPNSESTTDDFRK